MKNEKEFVFDIQNEDFLPKWDEIKPIKQNKKTEKPARRNKENRKKEFCNFIYKAYLSHKVADLLKVKFKTDGITRSIDKIAQEIVDKNAYELKIKYKSDKEHFWKDNTNNKTYLTKSLAIKSLINSKEKLIQIEKLENIKIDTKFSYILKCEQTNTLFPPPSHNLFNNLIEQNTYKNEIQTEQKRYIESLVKLEEISEIEKLNSIEHRKVAFKVKETRYNSLQDAKKAVIERVFEKQYRKQSEIKISHHELNNKNEFSTLKIHFNKHPKKYIINDIKSNISLVFNKFNFSIFKRNNIQYISAYKKIIKHKQLSGFSQLLYDKCDNHEITVHKLLGLVEELQKTKIEILQEIKLLIKDGLLRQYENGVIEKLKSE